MERPHQSRSLLQAGVPLGEAAGAVVCLHGRGATARSILRIVGELDVDDVAFLAPQAAGSSWYPHSFLAPVEANEPGRSSGLEAIADTLAVAGEAGIPADRVLLLGFSQGACLAGEFVARHPRRYGGLAVLSGGLIGETVEAGDFGGELEGTPVFLGCSDVDPHIPLDRVHRTADIFENLGADVTTRIFPGMGHGVNQEELVYISRMIGRMID